MHNLGGIAQKNILSNLLIDRLLQKLNVQMKQTAL